MARRLPTCSQTRPASSSSCSPTRPIVFWSAPNPARGAGELCALVVVHRASCVVQGLAVARSCAGIRAPSGQDLRSQLGRPFVRPFVRSLVRLFASELLAALLLAHSIRWRIFSSFASEFLPVRSAQLVPATKCSPAAHQSRAGIFSRLPSSAQLRRPIIIQLESCCCCCTQTADFGRSRGANQPASRGHLLIAARPKL